MNIRLGKQWMYRLETVGNWMRTPGEKRPSPTKIVKELIEDAERKADPPTYRTTGPERH